MAAERPEGKGARGLTRLSNERALGIAARHMDAGATRGQSTALATIAHARPHPIVMGNAVTFAAFVALVVTLLIKNNPDLSLETDWRIAQWGIVVALLGFVLPLLRWRTGWIELDAEHVRWTIGILPRRHFESRLDELQGIVVEQGWVGKALGYATLRVVDATGAERVYAPAGDVGALRAAAVKCDTSRRGRREGRRT